MSIPKACVEAAHAPGDFELQSVHGETRARGVILALAEAMPESAVTEALRVVGITRDALHEQSHWPETMHAAIVAFLKHVAGDSP